MAGFCGDIRIVRRFDRMLEDITSSGSLSPRKFGADRAGEVAAHRFLEIAASERAGNHGGGGRSHGASLPGSPGRRGAGHERDQFCRARQRPGRIWGGAATRKAWASLFIRWWPSTRRTRRCWALLGAKIWTRPIAEDENASSEAAFRGQGIHALDRSGSKRTPRFVKEPASIVQVGDRENDIYQAFARKPANVDVITRARADRKLSHGGLLFAAADGFRRRHRNRCAPCGRSSRVSRASPGAIARVAVSFG